MPIREAVVIFNGFHVEPDSIAAAMRDEWMKEGGTYRDLMVRALTHYEASGEYLKALKELGGKK